VFTQAVPDPRFGVIALLAEMKARNRMRATAAAAVAVLAGGLAVAGPAVADTSPTGPGAGLSEPLRLVISSHPGGSGGQGGTGGSGNGSASGNPSGSGGQGGAGGSGNGNGQGHPGTSGGHGDFRVTLPTVATLTLSGSRTVATGNLGPVTVSDTRPASPGWTVFGQASDSGGTVSGDALGWIPAVVSSAGRVSAGRPVLPQRPGLGTAARLGSSAGKGTAVLSARLSLALPPRPAASRQRIAIVITLTITTAAV
jgi:hypothetical protein